MAAENNLLGAFEELVLLSIYNCRDNADGSSIRNQLEESTNRLVTVGALYKTLERLHEKGLISYTLTEEDTGKGRRPKRLYKIEYSGIQALNDAEKARRYLVPISPVLAPLGP